ncbi:Plastocyanin B [Artemisia annua]|uniref:Plastocyanin B n=1 Tax=Artemisia annua TaxID=35608 RepID=A0A2U1LBJ7_ARTAN|nr:Plastocyanin B [Artemisia annua]
MNKYLTVPSRGKRSFAKTIKPFHINVVFDEDEIPAGVDASKIIGWTSRDLLNGPGELYSVT